MNIQQALDHWPLPDKNWEAFDLPFSIGGGRPEFLGTGADTRILMKCFRNRQDSSLNGHIWFSDRCFGPPGFVHGGISAYILDEVLGATAWMNGFPSVAMELKIKYLQLTPLATILKIKSTIGQTEGDHIYLSGQITDDEAILTSVEGCFHKIDPDRILKAASQAN